MTVDDPSDPDRESRGDPLHGARPTSTSDDGVLPSSGRDETTATDGPERSTGTDRSVVVPVYDEPPEAVRAFVHDLLATWDEVVVAVDDPDAAMRQALDVDTPAVTVSTSGRRRGKGGAIADGLAVTSGSVVGYVDADGSVSVDDLDRLYRIVESGDAAMAVGSRHVRGSERTGQSAFRRVLGRGYGRLASLLVDAPVRDLQCGAKAFSRDVWETVGDGIRETGFAFDTELVVRADRAGVEVREEPIDWADEGGSTVDPLRDAPRMLGSLARLRLSAGDAVGSHRYPPDEREETGEPSGGSATPTEDDPFRIALVTAHPPDTGHLAEYGEQLARAYDDRPDVDLTVLAPRTIGIPERPSYDLRHVWERDSLCGAVALLRELRGDDFDAVHFNVHMTYFGERNVYRFLGLLLPPTVRLTTGRPVVTTLHDMLDVVAEDAVDQDVGAVSRLGARVATQALLASNATTVTSEAYRAAVDRRYLAPNVYHVPHGTFGVRPAVEPTIRTDGSAVVTSGDEPFRVMIFGHLGPTKDVESVVDAVDAVRSDGADVELVVAGDSHPQHQGYRERLERRFGDRSFVTFTGYVPESDLDELWRSVSLLVVPYRTSTGVSGVFQLAKRYGTPAVVYDAEGMRTSTVGTGGSAAFVPVSDVDALADEIRRLRDDPGARRAMAQANADAAADCTMDDVAARFVDIVREVRQ